MPSNEESARIFDDYAARVHGWCRKLGLGPDESEDALQEIFVVLFRILGKNSGQVNMIALLYQITRKVAANARRASWWRKAAGWNTELEIEDMAGVETDPAKALAVHQVIRQMSFKLAEVLVLSDAEGYHRDEIAALLRIAPGTVASRLRLARAAFAKLWQNQEGELLPAAAEEAD